MRARANLGALSKLCDVDVVILRQGPHEDVSHLVGLCGNIMQADIGTDVGEAGRSLWSLFWGKVVTLLHPLPYDGRLYSTAARSLEWPVWSAQRYDYVFAFRVRSAPLALAATQRMQGKAPKLVMDMDDIESMVFQPQESLAARLGRAKLACLERRIVRQFDLTLVCSPEDRPILKQRVGQGQVAVLPNIAPPKGEPKPSRESSGVPMLLFVGLLDYAPNVKGIEWFCRDVLPLIRAAAGSGFEIAIVGRDPTSEVLQLDAIPEVRVVGEVEETGSWFARAEAMIVPLHFGGGTRIKILEAFSSGCPVVSTTFGARGLGVADREELLLADSAEDFAAACLEATSRPELRDELTRRAAERVACDYDCEALERYMRAVLDQCSDNGGIPRDGLG